MLGENLSDLGVIPRLPVLCFQQRHRADVPDAALSFPVESVEQKHRASVDTDQLPSRDRDSRDLRKVE
ncbi:MAG: hypothetical protein SYR96_36735, partial [Actinomycetota bacterium]|nr:hypothetical protein [Actinomycetota bacterium]